MRRAVLGASGPEVGVVGLGCMGMSWAYDGSARDDATSLRVIAEWMDRGAGLLDTSDQYGPFTNEALVGRALAGRRDEVALATKGGLVVGDDGTTRRDGRPTHLTRALEGSLRRLGTDCVDLYQLHRVDPDVPIEGSWEAMASAVQDGKARQIGLSEVGVEEIQRAQRIHPVASVQTELSLWSRDALTEVLPYCVEHGITFIAYAPLGRGFLSGRFRSIDDLPADDWRARSPRFRPESLASNHALLEPLERCAGDLGATPAQVALAWVLAQGRNVVAIPGTTSLVHLNENAAAAEVELSAEHLAILDGLPVAVGARY